MPSLPMDPGASRSQDAVTPRRRILSALGAGWANRFFAIALNLVLTPILFRSLSPSEFGVWVMMLSAIGLLALLDFGLTSTLPRRFSFATGKAKGGLERAENAGLLMEVQDLLVTGNRLYLVRLVMTLGFGAVLLVIVPHRLNLGGAVETEASIAWALLVISQAAQLWGAAWSGALKGFGRVTLQIGITTAVTIVGLVGQILVALAGGGLIGLACVAAPMPLISRHVTIHLMRRLHPEIDAKAGRWAPQLARSMLQPSIGAWLLTLSVFVILRADSFLIAAFVGVQEISRYFAAMQIYNTLAFASGAILLGAGPLLSQKWAAGGKETFARQSLRLIAASQFTAAAAAGSLAAIGERLIGLWIGAENYAGDAVVWLLCVRLYLDAAQTAVLSIARSTEYEEFAALGIGGAVMYVALAYFLAGRYGVAGIVAANIIAQGVTLHSVGMIIGARRIGPGALRKLAAILAEAAVVSALAFVAAWGTLHFVDDFRVSVGSDVIAVAGAVMATGAVLLAALWFRVLAQSERELIVRLLRARKDPVETDDRK